MPNEHVSVLSWRPPHTHTSVEPQVQQTQQLCTLLGKSDRVGKYLCPFFLSKAEKR